MGMKRLSFTGENDKSELILLTDDVYPRICIHFGGDDSFREPQEIDVESFIGVKSYKAKGKRITTLAIERVEKLEPLRFPKEEDVATTEEENDKNDATEDLPTLFD